MSPWLNCLVLRRVSHTNMKLDARTLTKQCCYLLISSFHSYDLPEKSKVNIVVYSVSNCNAVSNCYIRMKIRLACST